MTVQSDNYREMLTRFPKGIYPIETIEISHSLLSQTYFLTKEPEGITATIETSNVVSFLGANITIKLNSKKADLDANFSFTLQDPNNVLDDELSRIPLEDEEKISLIYRVFNSNDLSFPAFYFYLSVFEVNQERGAFTMTAGADQLNFKRTGEDYNFKRFEMLRAL